MVIENKKVQQITNPIPTLLICWYALEESLDIVIYEFQSIELNSEFNEK